jgi:hypothetical protein
MKTHDQFPITQPNHHNNNNNNNGKNKKANGAREREIDRS